MGQKTTQEQISWQNGLYIEALQDINPRHLTASCKQLIREAERFPRPKEIRDAARAIAAEETERAALESSIGKQQADQGADARNEAIQLLGMFHPEAAGHLGPASKAHVEFVAEAARIWQRVRPSGGLREVDAIRGGRGAYGFALEAWARKYLGFPALHPAYVTDRVRSVYTTMTGEQPETLVGEPIDAGALSGPMSRAMQQARAAE